MKAYCPSCKKHTNVDILHKECLRSGDDEAFAWTQDHYLNRCMGCDQIAYAIESTSELDSWDVQTGDSYSNWKTYPSGEGARGVIDGFQHFPPKIQVIYQEVIAAMNHQLPVLSGIGLRGMIEAICNDRGVPGGNLKDKIDGLASSGFLAPAQASILHSHRFLGNRAAHEILPAKPKELIAALVIAETILKTIYVLPALSDEIKHSQK